MYDWSDTPREHVSWTIGSAVVERMLKTSRMHSLAEPNYKGPIKRESLPAEWAKVFDSLELALAMQHSLVVEFLFFVDIGSGDLPHQSEVLIIRYY
jgi:hypothetical protein